MAKIVKIVRLVLEFIGINIRSGLVNIKGLGWYLRDYRLFARMQQEAAHSIRFGMPFPILADKTTESGSASGHYFHQDLLVAQKIFLNNPVRHIDVGSRLDGLVAHVATFREIEVVDIRPLHSAHKNIVFKRVDFMDLDDCWTDYADSVSCLHVIEHFGLGRYGDKIDPDGHLKGLDNLYKILKQGGKFYFSTPIGHQRINFNAHRVFSIPYLLALFNERYHIDSFSYVNDEGDICVSADVKSKEAENNFSCTFGCGIFEMTKI